MPADEPFDLTRIDFSRPVADQDQVRAVNPHRFEMELLTAVVLVDPANHLIVGYKDLGPDEFWARGHMPGCRASGWCWSAGGSRSTAG
jgi:3-hydroxyacyl-[acyl-carrier-protein] dehydratase